MKVKLAVFVTVTVFAWSGLMAALGEIAAAAALAPVLGLTVQQIVHAGRTRPAAPDGEARSDASTPAPGADREGNTS